MLVSIITVCLNAEKCIEACIKSIVEQEYRPLEYVIIDGGSKDSTLDIIRQYAVRYNFIRYISEKDNGISDAFNKGISNSKGEIIGLVNSDDWLEPNIIGLVIQKSHEGEVIHGKLQYWKSGVKDYVFVPEIDKLTLEMTLNHPTVFVKKSVYEKYGNFRQDFKYAMDYELMLRFYLNNVRFYFVDAIISNMSLDGVSDKNWTKSLNEVRKSKIYNGLSPSYANLYFVFQLIRGFVSRKLQKFGLTFFLKMYRNKLSIMKKYKND